MTLRGNGRRVVPTPLPLLRVPGLENPSRSPCPPQFGTVMDNPLEYYSGRLTSSERKATLTEQLLADDELTASRKKRYGKLQEAAQAHGKIKRRKTDLPRKKGPKHRPKH